MRREIHDYARNHRCSALWSPVVRPLVRRGDADDERIHPRRRNARTSPIPGLQIKETAPTHASAASLSSTEQHCLAAPAVVPAAVPAAHHPCGRPWLASHISEFATRRRPATRCRCRLQAPCRQWPDGRPIRAGTPWVGHRTVARRWARPALHRSDPGSSAPLPLR